MNPELPSNPREELERRVTSLLLGELSEAEAAAVRDAIAQDPELQKLHDDLKQTIRLVREATVMAGEAGPEPSAPLKLSEERRQSLLTAFIIPPLKPEHTLAKRQRQWFVPVAVAATIVAVLGGWMFTAPRREWEPLLALNERMETYAEAQPRRVTPLSGERPGEERINHRNPAPATPAPNAKPSARPVDKQDDYAKSGGDAPATTPTPNEPDASTATFTVSAVEVARKRVDKSAVAEPKIAPPTTEIVLPKPESASGQWGSYDGVAHGDLGGVVGGRSGAGEGRVEPPDTRVQQDIPIKYANAADMAAALDSLTDGRSKATADSAGDKVTVLGTDRDIRAAEELARKLDAPTKQVLVEARPTETQTGVPVGDIGAATPAGGSFTDRLREIKSAASSPAIDPSGHGVHVSGIVAGKPAPARGPDEVQKALSWTTTSSYADTSGDFGLKPAIVPPGEKRDGFKLNSSGEITVAGSHRAGDEVLVPLDVKVPAPAFKGTPRDLPVGKGNNVYLGAINERDSSGLKPPPAPASLSDRSENSKPGEAVPVLGDVPALGRLYRSEESEVASAAPTFQQSSSAGNPLGGFFPGTSPAAPPTSTLTKSGSGTLTLSGDNTYAGATVVSGGTLTEMQADETLKREAQTNRRILEGEKAWDTSGSSQFIEHDMATGGKISRKLEIGQSKPTDAGETKDYSLNVAGYANASRERGRSTGTNSIGDPEWFGVLEQPAKAKESGNQFAGRYAYAAPTESESLARGKKGSNIVLPSTPETGKPGASDPLLTAGLRNSVSSEYNLWSTLEDRQPPAGDDWSKQKGQRRDLLEKQIASTKTELDREGDRLVVNDHEAAGAGPAKTLEVKKRQIPNSDLAQGESQLGEIKKRNETLKGLKPEQLFAAQKEIESRRAPEKVDAPLPRRPATNAPVAQLEILTSENNFSTFSLNVSDVSFKLAAASLEQGQMPDSASIRSEEFINAFDYRDPEAAAGAPVVFTWERARYPFAHNRDLLRFSLKTAAAGRQAGRPLNVVLLLDNSGSMERADRVSIIREALRVLAAQLQPQDKLSVITFARTPRLVADGLTGDKAGEVTEQVGGLTPEGGTNLEDAMNLAYQTAAKHFVAQGINRVVVLTDGAANLGDVEPESLKQKVEAQRQQGIALDCFGIGWEGFNDDLLEVLSRNGDGRYGFINSPEEAASEFAGQLAGALKVAASDVKVQVEWNPKRVTAYRQIGYARHQLTKEQFRDNTVDAAEIAAQEAGNALYTVEVNPAGEGPLGTVHVRYKIPGTTDYREQAWDVPFAGNAVALEQASPAMRLAASASAFSEWLAVNPFSGEVTPEALLNTLRGVPEVFGADPRPRKLEWMIRQAKSLEGK